MLLVPSPYRDGHFTTTHPSSRPHPPWQHHIVPARLHNEPHHHIPTAAQSTVHNRQVLPWHPHPQAAARTHLILCCRCCWCHPLLTWYSNHNQPVTKYPPHPHPPGIWQHHIVLTRLCNKPHHHIPAAVEATVHNSRVLPRLPHPQAPAHTPLIFFFCYCRCWCSSPIEAVLSQQPTPHQNTPTPTNSYTLHLPLLLLLVLSPY